MAYKVYHKTDSTPKDRPVFGRARSLDYYKKVISYYMPIWLMRWNKSTELTQVRDLTDQSCKEEAGLRARQAVEADTPFEKEEFKQGDRDTEILF